MDFPNSRLTGARRQDACSHDDLYAYDNDGLSAGGWCYRCGGCGRVYRVELIGQEAV